MAKKLAEVEGYQLNLQKCYIEAISCLVYSQEKLMDLNEIKFQIASPDNLS